ncbi:angiopoietin-4-like [Drosophila busckii]|uniref:angiopoietin-4-like n=1 Tax=Drosophila busckii TaxID=30019 RepID=UPI0014333F38|nr:angiopoietin-4-like [Drosophila busckii]
MRDTFQAQIEQNEFTIKKLEASVEAQKETLKESEQLQAKINELQTKLKAQQETLKRSDELNNYLISEKDKRIVDLDRKLEASVKAQKETLKESEQLQSKVHEQEIVIKTQDFTYKELKTNNTVLKDQFQAKFEQQELTIKKLESNIEAQKETLKLIEQLQARVHEQDVVIKTHELMYKEQQTNYTLMKDHFQAQIEEKEFSTYSLQNEVKNTLKKSEQFEAKIRRQEFLIKTQQHNITLLKDQFQAKFEQQELTIKKLEAGVEAQKETLKESALLQAKVNQLQTKIEVQQEALRSSDELITEKDKRIVDLDERIADLKEQINNMNKNKQFEDKLIKYVEQAEVTRCVPYGNDIQTIRVPGTEAFQVPCDYKFADEGWTIVQRRMDGSVNFNRTWDEYKHGFGDLRGEFWLGLEKLHLMTKFQLHELYIELEDIKSETRYARYSNFIIGNEAQSYELLSLDDDKTH